MKPFFSLSILFHLLDLLRLSRLSRVNHDFAKVSVALLYNAGCICEAMSKMARSLITPGKC